VAAIYVLMDVYRFLMSEIIRPVWYMVIQPMIPGLFIMAFVLGLGTSPASATVACTPGTDCYGDCVRGPVGVTVGGVGYKNLTCSTKFTVGVPVDTLLRMVEDFEAPTMRNNQGVGGGAPYWGPWYDDGSGNSTADGICNRGDNSYWNRTYSNGVEGVIWASGQPSSPALGCPCTGFGFCTGMKTWDVTNRWGGNNFVAAAMVMTQPSDFSAEIGTIQPPTGAAGGGTGVFDGNATWGWRIQSGFNNTNGILGAKSFTASRTFGMTMALAYPNNSASSLIWNRPWKHNEWLPGGDGLIVFHNTFSFTSQSPFEHFIFFNPSGGDPDPVCQAALNAATKTLGDFECRDVIFNYRADTTRSLVNGLNAAPYNHTTDFPLGTWGCVRGLFENAGLTNTRIRIWFTGASGVEKQIIDISNMNTSFMPGVSGGVNGFSWDGYSNYAGDPEIATGLAQTTFRYEDNIHIRAGTPVSCAQIGFSSTGGGGSPPQAPTQLTYLVTLGIALGLVGLAVAAINSGLVRV